ncbi:MAG: type III-A CRISPR-associated protein Cas10/Csm1, partial [Acaryochloris sp. SU_5_25]|nr:type III-A CRISPR-associated protein Cas10/Csm1 [Acaryochloris sp. SU_5_25]
MSPTAAVGLAVQTAQDIVGYSDRSLNRLQLVFDSVHLNSKSASISSTEPNYRPAWSLKLEGETYPRIPYAQKGVPNDEELTLLHSEIQAAIATLDWQNLAQLTLFVEKFGSHLSFGDPDIALIDVARSTAAIAAALAQEPPDNKLALVGGDLMGVQKFIYTISSEGALKSLRARSFYLELATEEVVQQILTELSLPRINVIYAGASKFYLLVAAMQELDEILDRIQNQFNQWLNNAFQC